MRFRDPVQDGLGLYVDLLVEFHELLFFEQECRWFYTHIGDGESMQNVPTDQVEELKEINDRLALEIH